MNVNTSMSQITESVMETKNRLRDGYVEIPIVNCNYFELVLALFDATVTNLNVHMMLFVYNANRDAACSRIASSSIFLVLSLKVLRSVCMYCTMTFNTKKFYKLHTHCTHAFRVILTMNTN
jgi:hypothetical protein